MNSLRRLLLCLLLLVVAEAAAITFIVVVIVNPLPAPIMIVWVFAIWVVAAATFRYALLDHGPEMRDAAQYLRYRWEARRRGRLRGPGRQQ